MNNIVVFIFECCICMTQDELSIKETGSIFKKHTLTQEFLSGTSVPFLLASLTFSLVLLTSFFLLVVFKILLHEWPFWIVTKYNSQVSIHPYFWTSSVLHILQFKYDSILSSSNHFNCLGYTIYLSESFDRVFQLCCCSTFFQIYSKHSLKSLNFLHFMYSKV